MRLTWISLLMLGLGVLAFSTTVAKRGARPKGGLETFGTGKRLGRSWDTQVRRGEKELFYVRGAPQGAWRIRVQNTSQSPSSAIVVVLNYSDGLHKEVRLTRGEVARSELYGSASLMQAAILETSSDVGSIRWWRDVDE